jgi:hypothetical protein
MLIIGGVWILPFGIRGIIRWGLPALQTELPVQVKIGARPLIVAALAWTVILATVVLVVFGRRDTNPPAAPVSVELAAPTAE